MGNIVIIGDAAAPADEFVLDLVCCEDGSAIDKLGISSVVSTFSKELIEEVIACGAAKS